jgi:TPP-dependent 2-oxoacid decarboxylase
MFRRTGMVIVALLSALYMQPISACRKYVETVTKHMRPADRPVYVNWPLEMPETEEQQRLVAETEPLVQQRRR